MKNVGECHQRNQEYRQRFSKEKLITGLIQSSTPILFDIGAHHGQSVAYLRSIFPKPIIYSFEPDPDSFHILESKAYPDNPCFNIAISNQTGTLPFFRNKISHTSSLLKVNVDSCDSIRLNQLKATGSSDYLQEVNHPIDVEVLRLDDFVKAHDISHIDLLKIDVQGAEVDVLAGGSSALGLTRNISIEISFFDFYERRSSFYDVEKMLMPLGFSLFSIIEVSQNPMNGRTDWAEVLYTKHQSHR